MSIPANITVELASLKAQVASAKPLSSAPFALVTALQLNAKQLVADIQAALVAPSLLDTYVPATDPGVLAAGVVSVMNAGKDQNKLSRLRGVTGRVSTNLNQLI